MRLSIFAATAVLVSASVAAHADSFDFDYTGVGISAAGILTASATATAGEFLITGISGERNGVSITGFGPGLEPAFPPDFLLFYPATDTGTDLNPTFLDNAGFSYIAGGVDFDIFTSDSRPSVVEDDEGPAISLSITEAAATPEPSSFALLSGGLLGVAGLVRKRFA